MKLIALFSFSLLLSTYAKAQQSEDLIPKDAVTVFSINNFSVLQKVSLDELVNYEFMAEIQQELFDGSTHGKTIKESGIDFNQKLNVFYGKTFQYEVSGFTFGISNKEQLFTVFDDFQKEESKQAGVERYSSYFNQLIIKGSNALLIRVEPIEENINSITDSIWYSRGNDYPFYDFEFYDDYDGNVQERAIEEVEESEEFYEELIIEGDDAQIEAPKNGFPEAEEINSKNYYELRDSVSYVLQEQHLLSVLEGLFQRNENLVKFDSRFKEQLTHPSDGIFYLDNSRNLSRDQSFWYMKTMFPGLYQDIEQLYTGNVMLGDILLNDNNVQLKMDANYGPQLGSIYQELNDSKFDKNVLNYIHKDNSAYFTYNVNLRQAYDQAFKVIMPILEDEKNARISANVLAIELLDEFINKDALFGTYKGSMFGSFNGIQKVATRKIEFIYDEETFDYEEIEVEAVEDMPIFTLGFSTDRTDIPEKVLNRLSRITSRFENKGGYWMFEDAILDAAPLYFINAKGLFILTNDEDLVKNHVNGYGKNAISGKKAKEIKKNGFMYAEVDWANTIERFPKDIFTEKQNEVLEALRGKSGEMKLTTSKTTAEKTSFDLVYTFTGEYENSGKYILDFINSMYVLTK